MHWIEIILILISGAVGAVSFSHILWSRRLKHVWPRRNEIKILNPSGFLPGVAEVLFQTRVMANRPVAGFFHALIF